MKKVVLACAIAAILAVGFGRANAYSVPGGWTSDPFYTHQTWSFATGSATSLADLGYISPGTPTAEFYPIANQVQHLTDGDAYGFGYNGVWNVTGPLTDTVVATFTLPQTPQPWTSSVQVNAIMQTNDEGFEHSFELAIHSGGAKYTPDSSVLRPIDAVHGIFEVTNLYTGIAGFDNPITVTMKTNADVGTGHSLATGNFANFDYVTIDTIPEPGTVAMLAAGALALLGWAGLRRRRS